MAGWHFEGYGRWTFVDCEVTEIAPGLYQARLRGRGNQYDVVDSTNYGKPSEAMAAAELLTRR